MRNYYTRACNFYHGSQAQNLIKKKLALPLCGVKSLAFDHIEILSRKKKNKLIHIKKINLLSKNLKTIIEKDIKKIVTKRSNLNKNEITLKTYHKFEPEEKKEINEKSKCCTIL